MNKNQHKLFEFVIIFIAGLIIGFIEISKLWLLVYSLAFVWGMNIGIYFNKK